MSTPGADPPPHGPYLKCWQSFERLADGLRFQVEADTGVSVATEITLPFADVIRLRLSPAGLGPPAGRLLTTGWPGADFRLEQASGLVALGTDRLSLQIVQEPWQLRMTDISGRVVWQERVDDTKHNGRTFECAPVGWTIDAADEMHMRETFALAPDEKLYGFGERFVPINQRGLQFRAWMDDAGGVSSQRAYKNVPFFLSSQGYGVFINSTRTILYRLGSQSTISAMFEVAGVELDYFLIYGPSPSEVIRRYWDLTGQPPAPPQWSFGLWSSRYGYRSRAEVEEVARGYRDRHIPCDVIHLDPWWMGEPGKWCALEWDTQAFPDPAGMIAGLRRQGFHVCLWINPYVPQGTLLYEEGAAKSFFVGHPEGGPYLHAGWEGSMPATAFVDFTNPQAIAWWLARLKPLLEMGVSAFKTDFGEWAPADGIYFDGTPGGEAHNLYPLLYNHAVFELVAAHAHTGGQGIVWARSATAGSQRYPVHWGGDPRTTFDHMAATLRGGLNFGLSGFPFWSHDIGGFAGESHPALIARWAQFGLFTSHARVQGQTPREPWVFGDEVEGIFRRYARLRYRLLPYLYSMAIQATRTGKPILRALLFDYPDDPTTHTLDLQYLFGDSFLVAPVFVEAADVPVYLPAGRWIDYWTGECFEGPRWLTVHAPLEVLPLFVKHGAVIPMGPEIDYVDEHPLSPLTLDIYPADAGSLSLYTGAGGPIEIDYRTGGLALTLNVNGYRGRLEVHLNGIPDLDQAHLADGRAAPWTRDERRTTLRFECQGRDALQVRFGSPSAGRKGGDR